MYVVCMYVCCMYVYMYKTVRVGNNLNVIISIWSIAQFKCNQCKCNHLYLVFSSPTSAALRAGPSLVPSPVTPTTSPTPPTEK